MSIYDGLNEMQRQAVFHTEGPLLVLAGAGSGKTRVLTHRIAYLIENQGVDPWNILAITFTNKAAGEMRERVDRLVGVGGGAVWVSTFHAACVRILRRHIDRIGYGNDFTIYDSDDQKTVMKEVCKRLNIDTKKLRERAILGEISRAKDRLASPEQYAREFAGQFWMRHYVEAYAEYQKELKKNNALDFDDLICKTVELFRQCGDVLESYQHRFRYIMVDEYQDTNTAQFQFISLLARVHQNLCVVGDDDQSIYKVRGANIRNILDFEKTFPDAAVVKLEQNYRSTGNILAAANAVIANNRGRKEKRLWTENPVGSRLGVFSCRDAYEEAARIAEDIRRSVEGGAFRFLDIACLYRTNAQSRILEERFLEANIPYKIFGGVNFYQRKEIKDLLAYLKLIESGRDDVAVRRIINVPRRGIGQSTIDRITYYAERRGISFYEALEESDQIAGVERARKKLQSFVTFVRAVRGRMEFYSLQQLAEHILDETGYRADLEAERTDEAEARLENLDELVNKIADYEAEAETPSLTEFLEEVALVADIDSLDASADYVSLMTIHSAKGLEFPKVYMSGMEDGLFPSAMTIAEEDPDALEEERRLCYVAITRAKQELTLSYARVRTVHGEMRYHIPSRYLAEIPGEYLNTGENLRRQCTPKTYDARPGYTGSGLRQSGVFDLNRPDVASGNVRSQQGFGPGLNRPDIARGSALGAQELSYGVGDRVSHVKFGEGTVTGILDRGRDYEVTVDFDRVGTKKMFAGFARLQKISL